MPAIDAPGDLPSPGDTQDLEELLQRADLMLGSDTQQAETLLQEGIALARQLGDTAREARATMFLGAAFSFRSEFHTALDLLHQAEALAQQLGCVCKP